MDVVRQELAQDLGRAVRALRSGNRSDARIHDIRKRLKHCRALLRLLRNSLGNDAYRVENARLRDAARPLMPVRDAAVLVRALDDLCPRGRDGGISCSSIRGALRRESRERREQLNREALSSSAQLVSGVARRMRLLPPAQLTRADAAKAVKRAYRTGRRAMTAAGQQRSRDGLHEWRKQVQYLANQLESLLPLMHKGLRKIYKTLNRLAGDLGDDHDLALLHDKIIQHRKLDGAVDAEVDALLQQLGRRRAKLQRKAYRRGKRLFAIGARRLETRVKHRLRARHLATRPH
jgi:CHAD domain-containing protein